MKKNKTTLEQEEPTKEPSGSAPESQVLLLDPSFMQEPEPKKPRTISLYGEIDEELASDVVYSLLYLNDTGTSYILTEDAPEDQEPELVYEPIEFLISTYGGSASEMFAIYDIMRKVREQCEIHTYGLGKVMSAGVLLLAAGTKGKRRIGKNCRVMMHSVAGASIGSLHSLENEMDEIKWLQEQHINCLIEETKMTRRQIKKMLAKRMNVYLTADDAVKLGIADEIV